MRNKLLIITFFIAYGFIQNPLSAQIVFLVNSPASVAGTYPITFVDNTWGIDMATAPMVCGTLVVVRDNTTGDSLGCNPLINSAQVNGKIAVVYRGSCQFGKKAYQAQLAGAIAVIIVNNVTGGPIGMAAGDDGPFVTIPTIMIGMEDGALLRPHINAGTVNACIGTQFGLYPNDIGISSKDVLKAKSFSIPSLLAQTSADFSIPLGAWVVNYGTNNQTGVSLSSLVRLGANVLYNQTSSAYSINSGDSVFIPLPAFSQPSYNPGYYTHTYSVTSSVTDDFPNNNNDLKFNFWINNSIYSKTRIDSVSLQPISTTHTKANSSSNWRWCIYMDDNNLNRVQVDSISFSSTTPAGISLLGKTVITELYQWNQSFNDIFLVDQEYYDYTQDLQGQFVTSNFASPVILNSNTKYMACLNLYDQDINVGYDNQSNYALNAATNNDLNSNFPVYANNTWYTGFAGNPVPSIIVHTSSSLPNADFTANQTSVCTGNQVAFTSTSTGSITSYSWNFGAGAFPASATGVGPHNVSYSTAGNKTISLTINGSSGSDVETKNNYISVLPTPAQPGAISGSINVCEGNTESYSIAPVAGAINYTWNLPSGWNGSSSTSSISTTTGSASGTIQVTANNSCGSSAAQTLNVSSNPTVNAGISIAANNTIICAGEMVTFTATPINGGTAPIYQWKLNGANAGTNSNVFSSPSFNNGDVVSCEMTSNAPCVMGSPAMSAALTISVVSSITPTLGISTDANPACVGSLVTFTSSQTGGGTTPAYQWKLNGSNVGTNSNTYSSSALNNGDEIECTMTSSSSCATVSTVNSNTIVMSMLSSAATSVSISASANSACAGSTIIFTATPVNGGTSPAYQWKLNGSNVGANSNTYSNSALVNNDNVTCEITSSLSCASNPTAVSNTVTMSIDQVVAASVAIAADVNPVCPAAPVVFTATPNNGGSSPAYQWMVNGSSVVGNGATYSNSTLANGNNITCSMLSNANCVTNSPAISNNVSMSIHPNPAIPAITPSNNILVSSTGNSYQWSWNGIVISGSNSQLYTATLDGDYTVTITDANGCSATSGIYTLNTSSIEKINQNSKVEIYPNPSSGLFTLLSEDLNGKTELKVYNLLGECVKSEQIEVSGKLEYSLDISEMAPGVYNLTIQNNNTLINNKIIKN
ncbi:MAG: T9SS type A sorting domain-containing protein [Bacteroidetes bacterium]|nr:T9SS type A sorting domain-containing protein [Bacteroidota bacterium]HET6242930.1 PA domain-containing protein [Bacteroidia bacterium]